MVATRRVTTSTLVCSTRGWFRYSYCAKGRRYIVTTGGLRALYYQAQTL